MQERLHQTGRRQVRCFWHLWNYTWPCDACFGRDLSKPGRVRVYSVITYVCPGLLLVGPEAPLSNTALTSRPVRAECAQNCTYRLMNMSRGRQAGSRLVGKQATSRSHSPLEQPRFLLSASWDICSFRHSGRPAPIGSRMQVAPLGTKEMDPSNAWEVVQEKDPQRLTSKAPSLALSPPAQRPKGGGSSPQEPPSQIVHAPGPLR